MKNYLIITIGTRDVQLRRDLIEQSDEWTIQQTKDLKTGYEQTTIERNSQKLQVATSPDFTAYYTLLPRLAGKQVADSLPLYRDVVELPLITPVVDRLATEGKTVDVVLTIYTNQQEEFDAGMVKKRFYSYDTIFFADIVQAVLQDHPLLANAEFDPYEIPARVADIDHQYIQFAKQNHSLFDDSNEVGEIFLLPQGGIDQINQAVTLQLIQAFGHKVKLYQKPDGAEPVILKFTDKFLDDLNKQKILKHLNDYDFGYIDKSLSGNKVVCHLAQYATRRLALQHNQLKVNTDILLKETALVILWPEFGQVHNTDEKKLIDLYFAAKINARQKKYGDFLWRIFTLNESLFKVKAELLIGNTSSYWKAGQGYTDVNEAWEAKLARTDARLLPYFKQNGIGLNNPYRKAYLGIYACMSGASESTLLYSQVADKLESLADKRHGLAHRLGTISLNELNQALGNDYKLDGLLEDLDQIFNITGFGIYDTIRDEIHNLL